MVGEAGKLGSDGADGRGDEKSLGEHFDLFGLVGCN